MGPPGLESVTKNSCLCGFHYFLDLRNHPIGSALPYGFGSGGLLMFLLFVCYFFLCYFS